MDSTVIIALVSGVGTGLTVFGAMWTQSRKSKENATKDRRVNLSDDEQKFRKDLLEQLDKQSDKYEERMDKYQEKIDVLTAKVELLGELNAHLNNENVKLMTKVDFLQESLDRFSHSTSVSTATCETHTVTNPGNPRTE